LFLKWLSSTLIGETTRQIGCKNTTFSSISEKIIIISQKKRTFAPELTGLGVMAAATQNPNIIKRSSIKYDCFLA
jgi:hypothetical protein